MLLATRLPTSAVKTPEFPALFDTAEAVLPPETIYEIRWPPEGRRSTTERKFVLAGWSTPDEWNCRTGAITFAHSSWIAGARRCLVLRTARNAATVPSHFKLSAVGVPRQADSPLFEDVDVLFGADLLEDLGPHAYGDFAEMRFPQQEHECAGLTDAAADAQRDFILHNGLVIGEFQEVQLMGQFQLLLQSFPHSRECPWS